MNLKSTLLVALVAVLLVPCAFAQFGTSGTTTMSVMIGPEAALRVDTATTTLSTSGTTFSNNYAGTTNMTYKARTTKVGGTASITVQVTSDFGPAGGPSVASPPTSGDALEYTCTVSSPGTACAGTVAAQTGSATSVATFGADARSTAAGNAASVTWSLTNDPLYSTGAYTATVTFTIAAT